MAPRDWTAHPSTAYALKGNIAYPGTSTQASAVAAEAEDLVEAELGLVSDELDGTFTVEHDRSL